MSDNIRIEDLSVGDWVNCMESAFNKPMRIESIGRHLISLVSNKGGEISGMLSMVDFEPVLLTPEILLANGFVHPQGHYAYHCRGILIHCRLHGEPPFSISMAESSTEIEYVHELQRVLRCVGLWDLANNFKLA